jgi:hypothetical protein
MTDCSNFTGKIGRFGKTVTLHKLPSNPSLKRAWIIAISRKNWRATFIKDLNWLIWEI